MAPGLRGERVVGPERALADGECALEQGGLGMRGSQAVLLDRERPPYEAFGAAGVAFLAQQHGQVADHEGGVLMLGSHRPLADGERSLQRLSGRAFIGHPELSTSSQLLLSFHDPGDDHVWVAAQSW